MPLRPILHINMAEQMAREALAAAHEPGTVDGHLLVQLAHFHRDMADVLLTNGIPVGGYSDEELAAVQGTEGD
jgi:hypothetical protein